MTRVFPEIRKLFRNFEAPDNVTFHAATVGMLILTILMKTKNKIPDK